MSISVLVAVAKEMALVLQVNRTSARGVPEVQSFRGLQLYPVQIDGFFMTHFTPKKTATFGNWPKEKVQLCQTSSTSTFYRNAGHKTLWHRRCNWPTTLMNAPWQRRGCLGTGRSFFIRAGTYHPCSHAYPWYLHVFTRINRPKIHQLCQSPGCSSSCRWGSCHRGAAQLFLVATGTWHILAY